MKLGSISYYEDYSLIETKKLYFNFIFKKNYAYNNKQNNKNTEEFMEYTSQQ